MLLFDFNNYTKKAVDEYVIDKTIHSSISEPLKTLGCFFNIYFFFVLSSLASTVNRWIIDFYDDITTTVLFQKKCQRISQKNSRL